MAAKQEKSDMTTEKVTKPAGKYVYGTGRRKTAVARVRLYEKGNGTIMVNGRETANDPLVIAPIELVGETGKWNISARVVGGGIQSRREAIRLGVARALLNLNADWRQSLKKEGYLTRDPREKERKKPGLKGARRAPQWAKR